ncbi:SPFH domain-containing protein [Streptomyces sp. NPDC087270]|uniref:SPFH domain-containing protein n=1 Tax=Streptomyces sp. NPDC087270 TaxID=3365774 RepID=UPI0038006977
MITTIVILVLLAAGAGYVGVIGRVVVPPGHVGIVRRRFGPSDPVFRRVTPYDKRGLQARVLPTNGSSWLVPGLYTVEIVPRVDIPEGRIGVVTAVEGRSRPAGQPLARQVECDNFQDGPGFLLGGGEQGRQANTLAGGQSYYINTMLFTVETEPRTYVPPGTVGVVEARAGGIRPPHRPFGRHVECNSFQDGHAFLSGGGEQGRQLAILGGGAYYDINPALFKVTTVANVRESRDGLTVESLQEIAIPIGATGVVVTLDGAEPPRDGAAETVAPRVEGHGSFRLPWVFLAAGGRRGVQQETLGEGAVCALNPWFVRVMLIPTRLLILEWTKKTGAEAQRNYDAELEQITVTIQGHRVNVEMKQSLQIPEKAAPVLVSQFGGTTSGIGGLSHNPAPVQRFVERVLGATVESYFSEIAAAATIQEFLSRYAETRTDLTAQVRNALLVWGVEAKGTTLGEFQPEDASMNEAMKREFLAEMNNRFLMAKLEGAGTADEIDEIESRKDRRRVAMQLEAELQAEIDALGPENAAVIRIVREFAQFQVPEYIGGGDMAGLVQALPMANMRDILGRLRELRSDHQVGRGTAAPMLDQKAGFQGEAEEAASE